MGTGATDQRLFLLSLGGVLPITTDDVSNHAGSPPVPVCVILPLVSLPVPNSSPHSLNLPTQIFLRLQYWDDMYKEADDGEAFSWYAGWDDLQPFVQELIPNLSSKILVPGVGNDGAIVGMYDSGFKHLTAFDYAPEGVACAKLLLGPERSSSVELLVADARDMPFEDMVYDAAFDKGTLDAVYLSGGRDKDLARKHIAMAVSELYRVIRPGGVVVSISAACVDAVQASFHDPKLWTQLRDGSTYITEDGYASNNVDGTILAYERML